MAIALNCPNISCGKLLSFPPELSGQTVKCDRCHHPVLLPNAESPEASTILRPQPPDDEGADEPQADDTPDTPETADRLVGKRLAHFEIIDRIAVGAMGAVYRARDLSLDRVVALKVISDELVQHDQSYVGRFLQEARLSARIEHPNVLPVYFIGCEGERLFIATQYIEGGSLDDRLRQRGRITPMVAVRIVREVALALAAAHAQHVIHRDIKPSNIMILPHGHVVVTDFGLAKLSKNAVTNTAVGSLVGTPAYMSPEQCEGLEPDQRSDLYCLGATFYHLLTGTTPYPGDSFLAVIRQHVDAPVPDPREDLPDLPSGISAVVQRLMAKSREDRYQTAEDVVRDLNSLLGLQRTTDIAIALPIPRPSPSTPTPQVVSSPWQKSLALRYLTVLVPTFAATLLCLFVWIAGLQHQEVRRLRETIAQHEASRGPQSPEFRAAMKGVNSVADSGDYGQAKWLCSFMKETFSQSPDVRSYLEQKHRNLVLLAEFRRDDGRKQETRKAGLDIAQLPPNAAPPGAKPSEAAIPGLSVSRASWSSLAPVLALMEGTPNDQRLKKAEEELSKLHPPALPAEMLKAFKEYLNVTGKILSEKNPPAED